MIRRKRRDRDGDGDRGDHGEASERPVADVQRAPAGDAAQDLPTLQQPAISRDVEPSPQVLDELLSFFGIRHGNESPPPAAGAGDVASPDVAHPDLSVPATDAATRVLAADELAAGPTVGPSPREPVAGADLQPAPTKHALRRSKREARREAKREAKRLKHHAKQARKMPKQAAGRGGESPAVSGTSQPAAAIGGSSDLVRLLPAGPSAPKTPESARGAAATPPSTGPPPSPPESPTESVAATGLTSTPAPPPPPPIPVGPASDRSTITIAADDLPDAVYLAGEPDGDDAGDRSTIFIDDKDPATGAIVTMDVATSAGRIEPRLRDRRIAVKRAIGRKRLKWIAAGITTVGLIVGTLALLGSSLFEVKRISVEGVVYSGGPELDAVMADLEGANVLRVDTTALERRIERIPWVADARVTTDFPNGATVEVSERSPVVTFQGGDGMWRVIDIGARVLAVLDGQPSRYLQLVVVGGTSPNPSAASFAPKAFKAAATLIEALGDDLRAQVKEASVDQAGTDLRLELNSGIEVRFGAANDLMDKLVRLQLALREINPEDPPTEMIDVSTPDYVVK